MGLLTEGRGARRRLSRASWLAVRCSMCRVGSTDPSLSTRVTRITQACRLRPLVQPARSSRAICTDHTAIPGCRARNGLALPRGSASSLTSPRLDWGTDRDRGRSPATWTRPAHPDARVSVAARHHRTKRVCCSRCSSVRGSASPGHRRATLRVTRRATSWRSVM